LSSRLKIELIVDQNLFELSFSGRCPFELSLLSITLYLLLELLFSFDLLFLVRIKID
jgi:hypothetical protein